jgi:hypothetical protein
MSRPRMRQDQQFWHIVKDLRWKLDDNNRGLPPAEPEFGYGGGRRLLHVWASHLAALILGAITFGLLLVAPAVVPIVGLGLAVTVALSYRRLQR